MPRAKQASPACPFKLETAEERLAAKYTELQAHIDRIWAVSWPHCSRHEFVAFIGSMISMPPAVYEKEQKRFLAIIKRRKEQARTV